MLTRIVEFADMNQMSAVFGPCDANIKLIEKTLPVTITGQGLAVKITGEAELVEKTASTIETLKMCIRDRPLAAVARPYTT